MGKKLLSDIKTSKKIKKKHPRQRTKQRSTPSIGSVAGKNTSEKFGAYSATQYQQYLRLVEELAQLKNSEIISMLKLNHQSMSGTKNELVNRAADGILLGQIPRCESCRNLFGGMRYFDQSRGIYVCPGYREGMKFKDCQKVFSFEEVPRLPWLKE